MPPFNLKIFIQTTERSNNNASHHDIERNLDKNVEEKINTTKDQKNTFQQIKQHKEPTKQKEQWRSVKNGIKQPIDKLEQQPTYFTRNSYQMLTMDDMEENEMLIESGLTKKSEKINKKKYSKEQANKGNNNQEYSMNNVMLERLNEMINEILVEEKYKV